jgi:Protein of unknown function (DUF3570)
VAAIRQRSTPKTLAALTSAALALPGMTTQSPAATPAAKVELEGGLFYYDEGTDRVRVATVQQQAITPVGDDFDVKLNAVYDSISGASPIYNVPTLECPGGKVIQPAAAGTETVSGASGGSTSPLPRPLGGIPYTQAGCQPIGVQQVISPTPFDDRRVAVDLKTNYYRGATTIGLGLGISDEEDYRSNYVTIDLRQDINQKRTTLAFGVSLADDKVMPVNEPGFTGDKQTLQTLVGLTQVLDKYSLAQVNLSYTDGQGYLTDPYKDVFVLDSNSVVPEQRPDERNQWNLLGRYVRFFPALDGALHLDYRFSQDDWGVTANTLETSWIQTLGAGWQATLGVRYYSQGEADFYQDYFDTLPGDGHYSSDYRLATFGALGYRLRLSKALSDSVRIDAGVEYYDRRVGLALESTDNTDAADYDFVTFNLGWKLSF